MSGFKKIIPLLDRVLVEKAIKQKATKGGVLLPESAVKSMNEGVVVAVGPGSKTSEGKVVPVDLKPGDRVVLPEYGGTKIDLGEKEKETYLYQADDILAKLE
mmetsp:Transcript_15731/g.27593  ORF Transcript_15731/g.27593 Transcript_15731/m.27593 type:complete len:102 (+) Transcript_15731:182-487(+)|eukprot:CAMPEP_0184691558 /NCGR_PEP_ID=MMETSP0313-20130426/378_1 /TAXON_ID=2792 /ORGANISM="Porphyridium aerugineum, Strain SAG 1380-2" /LENGTH=101 /DNA_ID=CAMNT_0027149301 /DNA_START=155 /DNA_END=460 /DNA_ORIENTATION=-